MPQASCFNHNILLKMWHWDRSMWEKKIDCNRKYMVENIERGITNWQTSISS